MKIKKENKRLHDKCKQIVSCDSLLDFNIWLFNLQDKNTVEYDLSDTQQQNEYIFNVNHQISIISDVNEDNLYMVKFKSKSSICLYNSITNNYIDNLLELNALGGYDCVIAFYLYKTYMYYQYKINITLDEFIATMPYISKLPQNTDDFKKWYKALQNNRNSIINIHGYLFERGL